MKRRAIFGLVLGFAFTSYAAHAAESQIYQGIVDGVAAGGYDAVSYLQDGGPKMGDAAHMLEWQGAKWYFASTGNLDLFKANPEKYAPQYGGYCAFAVSKGSTAKGDPTVYTVVDGKVYFNLSKPVQDLWQQDIPSNISAADANWPTVLE
jgi:YHS domain-containing protein